MLSVQNTVDEPVFVVGVSRSGTTLFEQILNRHPRLSIYHELHFFHRVRVAADSGTLNESELKNYLGKLINLADEGLDTEVVAQRFRETDRSVKALYETILRLHMEQDGKARMGEKTPSNFWFLDELFAWFPKARVIFMMRNPHSVHGSFKKYDELTQLSQRDRNVFGRALYWNYGARVLRESQARYPGRVMCVRFEELIKKPEEVLPAVCDFLEEGFHEDMLEIQAVNSSFEETSEQSGFRKETLQRHGHLSYWERLLIDGLSGNHILENNYPLAVLPEKFVRVSEKLGFYRVLNSIHGVIRGRRWD